MKSSRAALMLAATILLGATGCGGKAGGTAAQGDSAKLAARESRLVANLSRPDSGAMPGNPAGRWVLPRSLGEISGLALTADGRLLVHNDELGQITELDYRRGSVGKHFLLGETPVLDDFEGITIANGTIYMLASKGLIYEFQEGDEGARVSFQVHDTKLGSECEFEGVGFDPAINSLLLACKVIRKKERRESVLIYRWKLDGQGADRISLLAVPLAQVVASQKWKAYHPSDITVDPTSGDYVLVSAQEEALVRLTPAGAVVSVHALSKAHKRTEGVAITQDSILIISDEADRSDAAITLYRWRPGRVASPNAAGTPVSPVASPPPPPPA